MACVCVCVCVCVFLPCGGTSANTLAFHMWKCSDQEQTSKHGKCENGSLRMIDETRKRNLRDSGWGIKSETVFPVEQNARYNSQNLERPLCWLSKTMSTTVAILCVAMYMERHSVPQASPISTSKLYSTKPPNPVWLSQSPIRTKSPRGQIQYISPHKPTAINRHWYLSYPEK